MIIASSSNLWGPIMITQVLASKECVKYQVLRFRLVCYQPPSFIVKRIYRVIYFSTKQLVNFFPKLNARLSAVLSVHSCFLENKSFALPHPGVIKSNFCSSHLFSIIICISSVLCTIRFYYYSSVLCFLGI